MRALFALFLSITLALASVSMAVARGQVPMGQEIALCTEDGAVSMVLDRSGKPVPGHRHLCPDCLSTSTAFMLPGALDLPAPHHRMRALHARIAAAALPSAGRIAATARGPPSLSV